MSFVMFWVLVIVFVVFYIIKLYIKFIKALTKINQSSTQAEDIVESVQKIRVNSDSTKKETEKKLENTLKKGKSSVDSLMFETTTIEDTINKEKYFYKDSNSSKKRRNKFKNLPSIKKALLYKEIFSLPKSLEE